MVYGAGKKTTEDKVQIISDHIHNADKCYPTGAAGVTVTSSETAWTLGNYAEIVPINTITGAFDIHWLNIEGATADGTYEVVLYQTTTEIARIRVTVTDFATLNILHSAPVMTPLIAANAQIQAKCMTENAAADAITVSIQYHTY